MWRYIRPVQRPAVVTRTSEDTPASRSHGQTGRKGRSMKVEEIEIHVGSVDFQYTALRQLEAKCEAPTAMSKAPSMDDVNAKLRELASSIGANAVINVEYQSGV